MLCDRAKQGEFDLVWFHKGPLSLHTNTSISASVPTYRNRKENHSAIHELHSTSEGHNVCMNHKTRITNVVIISVCVYVCLRACLRLYVRVSTCVRESNLSLIILSPHCLFNLLLSISNCQVNPCFLSLSEKPWRHIRNLRAGSGV